ncbi:MAG: histone-like nucleoid-structuring protein Lsr2 [Pseudonocardiaceae bacterium]
MQKITLIDDCDGTEGAETVTFGLDNINYEIDLSRPNAGRLRGDLSAFIHRARKLPNTTKATRTTSPKASTDRKLNTEIRAWAMLNGYQLAERGRIRKEILDAYQAAQAKPEVATNQAPEPAFNTSWH